MVTQSLGDAERMRLLAEVRALVGAPLQKLWLPSSQVCVLQFRLPGRTALVVLDARLGMAAAAERRPTAPDSAPRSQATLRNALSGARLSDARLETAADRGAPSPRLEFETPAGARSIVAEQGGALVLLGPDRRIAWASSGAGAQRRPGMTYPATADIPIPDLPPLPQREDLVRNALDAEESSGVAARRRELLARLRTRAQKLRRTLAAVEEDARRAEAAEEDRKNAELLLPHQSRIPRGAREARVPDWSRLDAEGNPAERVLQLDPAFSAAANAERWLKKARRYGAARERIAARRVEVARALAEVERLRSEADRASDAASLASIEAQVAPASSRRERRAAAEGPRLPYRTFRSRSGASILVGRSAKDNDVLTVRIARGNDLWLHARGAQGSHVVVPAPGDAPDAGTLGDAALLAAYFSSLRGEEAAEVAWTRCKYVRKPKGSPPGAVTYSQDKTLRVRLDPERLSALLGSET